MKLPDKFRPLFWDVKFESLDTNKNKRLILTRTLNYGRLSHWKWLSKAYNNDLKKELEKIPATEFRTPALKLAKLIYNLDEFKYASRDDYIRSQKTS